MDLNRGIGISSAQIDKLESILGHKGTDPLVARDLERPGLLVLNGSKFRQINHHTPQGRSRLSAPVRFEHGQDDALLLERSQGRRGRGPRGSLRTWTAA